MFLDIFQYIFMQKAFIVGFFIAIACALLGVFLNLRQLTLIGDGIAHVAFGGISCGLIFNFMPFLSALIFALLGAVGILHLKEKTNLYGDTAIGIISHASLGLGVFIVSLSSGYNIDLFNFLFGNILAIKNNEVYLTIILSLVVIISIILFYNELFFIAFDESSAKTSGIKVQRIDFFLVLITAFTVVSAMKIVGLLMASALIIMPSASALQVKTSFKNTLFIAVIIAIITVFIGISLAYYYNFSVSGTIVLLNLIVFLILGVYYKL